MARKQVQKKVPANNGTKPESETKDQIWPTVKELGLVAGLRKDGTVIVIDDYTIYGLEIGIEGIEQIILNAKKGMVISAKQNVQPLQPLEE